LGRLSRLRKRVVANKDEVGGSEVAEKVEAIAEKIESNMFIRARLNNF
jgi:hypothetical protein